MTKINAKFLPPKAWLALSVLFGVGATMLILFIVVGLFLSLGRP